MRPPREPASAATSDRCQARVQTEWGTRCTRKATTVVNGVRVCSQHAKVNLDPHRDVVKS